MNGSPVTDRPTDEVLVQRTAAGDREAFAALYRRRRPDVFRFAVHMTADPTVAEDVVQDVFMTVMQEADRFEAGRAAVVAWLFGIARNQLRQRLARDRRLEPLAHDEETPDWPAAASEVLTELLRVERVEAVRRAVLSLPLRYREAVVLCDLQEFSYADASDALSCAVGTVRSRLHRGRALLASKLRAPGSGLQASGAVGLGGDLSGAAATPVVDRSAVVSGRVDLEPRGVVS